MTFVQTASPPRKFKELKDDFKALALEQEVLKFWREEKIFEKSIQSRTQAPPFVFYEGPPTANGKPGIHHVIARTIKDLICRYKTMQGFRVERKGGWDTHGLPVELEVERELGLNSKARIEAYGVEKFNARCKESVFRYVEDWNALTERIGYWLDLRDAYITCDNNYIESVWWILAQFHQRGLIYKGHKVVPYCPRCGTGLSSHEVALGYEEITEDSIYVRFRLKKDPKTSILSWTTTPWTLPGNVALAVGEEIDYVKVKQGDEFFVLARARLGILDGNYGIVQEMKGRDLVGLEYEPLYTFLDAGGKKAYYVAAADFVTTEEGTGVVHTAVMYGADDYRLGEELDLPKVHTVDDDGKFKLEVTLWAGQFVKDAEPSIITDLNSRGLLYKKEKTTHTYPFCWRCESPLLYYARQSWYLKTSQFREQLLKNNRLIHWYPPEIGQGRFGEWLENNVDWALSRERYWGTPLPIWLCEKCDCQQAVESRSHLQKLSGADTIRLDLHKPFIDQVTFPCPKCRATMRRTSEVIDAWFDSGSMPYAQWHYPFESKEKFKAGFPSDFISEGIDQTRGWFYSLLAISTLLFDQPAYKNVIVIELILDKEGQKMSKTKGNVVDPWEVLNREGADALRWYLVSTSQPWLPTRFNREEIVEVQRKLLSTLRNVYAFFALYANLDRFDPAQADLKRAVLTELDRWILSRSNSLVREVTESLNGYDITGAARLISDFVIEELSNWYVRRSRRRFWVSGEPKDKRAAYATLHTILLSTVKLCAPFIPFLAEELYRALVCRSAGEPESVHLARFPVVDARWIDSALEARMQAAMQLVALGRAARNKSKVRIRQPLPAMKVVLPGGQAQIDLGSLAEVVQEELNVKQITRVADVEELMTVTAKPNFALLGPKFGQQVKRVAERIRALTTAELRKLQADGVLTIEHNGARLELDKRDVEITELARGNFAIERNAGYAVALDLTLTEALVDEGLAREVVNRIQNMRKEAGFDVSDRITLSLRTDARLAQAIAAHRQYIQQETLAMLWVEHLADPEFQQAWQINGHPAQIALSRVRQTT